MGDSGIAPVIGVAIAAAVAVTFSAGAVVVLVDDDKPAQPEAVGYRAITNLHSLRLLLTEGDELPLAGGTIWVTVDGSESSLPLTTFSDELGDHWNKGERVCLVGYEEGCDAFPNGEVTAIRIASADQALWDWTGGYSAEALPGSSGSGGGGSGGAGSGGGGAGSGAGGAGAGGESEAGAPDADLTGSLDGASPSDPSPGQSVTFTATVSNAGSQAPSGSFTVGVYVDGTLLSTHTLQALAGSQSTQVTSAAWSAQAGEHTVTVVVDDGEEIEETNEGNNGDALALDVSSAGVLDPGHAYEDVDNDLRFTNGLDIPIVDADIHDGSYQVSTSSYGLVVPSSVGAIAADAIDLASGSGGHLHLGTNLTATSGDVQLDGGTWLNATGLTLSSATGQATFTSQGRLALNGTSATAHETLHLESEGDVWIENATLEAGISYDPPQGNNKVTICHYPPGNPGNAQTITISENAVQTHEDHHDDYQGPCIEHDGVLIQLGSGAATVHVQDVTIDDPDDTAIVTPATATITGSPAQGTVEHHDPEPIEG